MPVSDQVVAVVARGMAFLDATQPGWREKIRRDNLDMSKSYGCIYGQLFGSYWSNETQKSLRDADPVNGATYSDRHKTAVAFGFNVEQSGRTAVDVRERLAELTEEWKRQLTPLLTTLVDE